MDDRSVRLKLLKTSVETHMISAQEAIQTLKRGKTLEGLDEAKLTMHKLESAIRRLVADVAGLSRDDNHLSTDEITSYTIIQIQAEELFTELKYEIGKNETSSNSNNSRSNNVTSKLPKMELARFSGDVLKWHEFWDQFSSNIDNRDINDVDKLLYLQSVLDGEAKRTLEGLDTTQKNYQIAITTLKGRYGKTSVIIDAHYAALYRIKVANKTVNDSRRVLNDIERHLRVLKSLGEDVNHNHLRVTILQKFSEDIIYELRMKMNLDTGTESIEEIRRHLESIISAREASNRMKNELFTNQEVDTSKQEQKYSLDTLHIGTDKERIPRRQTEKRYFNRQQNPRKRSPTRFNKMTRRESSFKRPFNSTQSNWSNTRGIKEPPSKRTRPTCIFCGNGHFNDECNAVKTVVERKARLNGRCYNCFGKGHQTVACRSLKKCHHCGSFGKHNRALCPMRKPDKTTNFHINEKSEHRGFTALQTAIVHINAGSDTGRYQTCRILLDCGSQRTYITKQMAETLHLPEIEKNYLSVFTFGADHPNEIESPVVKFNIMTQTNEHKKTIFANVVPLITNRAPTITNIPKPAMELLNGKNKIKLADDGTVGDMIDILIGNDYYSDFTTGEKIKIMENLYLINSIFGWLWSGKIKETSQTELSAVTYFQSSSELSGLTEPDLPLKNNDFKQLWDLESIGIYDTPKNSRDEEAIKQFNATIKYVDKRYHAKWPWIEFPPLLPCNYGLAYGRLISLLKRTDQETIQAYDDILKDQLSQGIIEITTNAPNEHPVHYLPHHYVRKGDKLRIVYDASAKSKADKSLNECLYRGPILLEDLTGLLIRFREHSVAVVADVEKAFLQVGLQNEDRDVTRFLWLKDITKPAFDDNIIFLRFCRVPFGIISSPFILNATIKHHLKKASDKLIDQISEDIYVDNLVTGSDSVKGAVHLYEKAKAAFSDLSMNLREWNSNSPEVIRCVPNQLRSKETDKMKVLGLNWHIDSDTLSLRFELTQESLDRVTTKREALRLIASVFDPCGFSTPLLLPAKLFLQDLWHKKIDWDDTFEDNIREQCMSAIRGLQHIQHIEIPRYLKMASIRASDNTNHELHVFTDASTQAYAAAVYLRSICKKEKRISFIIGKSRLVGKDKQTDLQIPKLELLGALIGSRLVKAVLKVTRLNISYLYLWTDSQIVISWCNSSKLLIPFVAKRIEEIKRNGDFRMRYVPTDLNPADVSTRPNATRESSDKWIKGPDFLKEDSIRWPNQPKVLTACSVEHDSAIGQGPTERETNIGVKETETHNRNDTVTISEQTEPSDITEEILKAQHECYPKEMKGIKTDLGRSLDVYKDTDGILRCRGRLGNTEWTDNQKHPILLPKCHNVTENIIKNTHQSNYHVGVTHTLSLIRRQYWIPSGRSQVQKILRQCQPCRKYLGGPFKLPPMAPLPTERVTYSHPFTFTGLDYFGPILIQTKEGTEKRWICLYTCLAVRAIHMEVVADLSAEECLMALRRFIATRGLPRIITSDNAPQFKLTAEVLTSDYCITNQIKWKFIPELAPWFGGFYERLIGIVKNCLKRTLDKQLLNDCQLNTVIKEVESVTNSRPLTAVNDLEHVLTPADFLHVGGISSVETSDIEFLEPATVTKNDLIDGWKKGQRILKDFIDIFTNQYLNSLRDRIVYHHQARNAVDAVPKVGELVQIKGGTNNRALWKVGRISALIKSADGNIRVAKICTSPKETLTRAISHLYPLEIHDRTTHTTTKETNPIETEQEIINPVQSPTDEPNVISKEPNIVIKDQAQRSKRLAAQRARCLLKEWSAQLTSAS